MPTRIGCPRSRGVSRSNAAVEEAPLIDSPVRRLLLTSLALLALLAPAWALAQPAAPAAESTPAGVEAAAEAPAEAAGPIELTMRPPSPVAATRAARAHAAHVRAARDAARQGAWADARRHFEAALLLDPDDAELITALADAERGAGDRRRALATLRRALELTDDRAALARRHVALGGYAEAVEDYATARMHYGRALGLAPSPAASERLTALERSEALALMSPVTFCPELADAWGCAPTSRPGDGGMRCRCQVERLVDTTEAVSRGVISTDPQGITAREPHVVVAAALLRLVGSGIGRLDARYLVVETASGGWQLVGRVAAEWMPGAAYVGRGGRLDGFGFREAGEATRGKVLVVRGENRMVDGDFEGNRVVDAEATSLWICHARPAPVCLEVPLARRLSPTPMRADEPPPPPAALAAVDWRLDATLADDGALVVRAAAGELPPAIAALVGRHALADLAQLEAVRVIPLR